MTPFILFLTTVGAVIYLESLLGSPAAMELRGIADRWSA